MLAVSDPQYFIPFGRQHLERHVDSDVGNSIKLENYTRPLETPYSKSLKLEAQDGSWILRENEDGIEEEIYFKDNTVILSRGSFVESIAHYGTVKLDTRLLLQTFTTETPVKNALWCTFPANKQYSGAKDVFDSKLHAVCIVNEKQLEIHAPLTEEYFTRLPFKVSSTWSSKYGLIIERATAINKNSFRFPSSNMNILPTIFALTHPLNEMSPFLTLKQGNILSFMKEQSMKIVFVSESPSLCLLYDYRTATHSVWKIRETTAEEQQMMNVRFDNEQTDTTSINKIFSNSLFVSNSSNPSSINRSCSVSYPAFSSPFIESRSQNHLSFAGHQNSSFSSYRVSSPRPGVANQSPSFISSPNITSKAARFNQLFTPGFVGSPKSTTPSADARFGNSPTCSSNSVPMPVEPELCLEYVWSESFKSPGDREISGANRAFISVDFIGQKYLCYVVSEKHQLNVVKFDETNDDKPEFTFGTVTTIRAKDASFLPAMRANVIIDEMGRIALYSGPLLIGYVNIRRVSPWRFLQMKNCDSPMTPQTSILTSTRTGDDMFDDFQQLSPVPGVSHHVIQERINTSDINTQPVSISAHSIRETVGSQANVKFCDGFLYRIYFSPLFSSILVKKCLTVLKIILPADAALELFAMWYKCRNAPGTQEISSEQEWSQFLDVLFRLLGYNVNNVPLLQRLNLKHTENPTEAKRKKECDDGVDSDFEYLLNSNHNFENASLNTDMKYFGNVNTVRPKILPSSEIDKTALLYPHISIVHFSLHLFYEEMKLEFSGSHIRESLVHLLYQLATDLGLDRFLEHYWRDHPITTRRPSKISTAVCDGVPIISVNPPDIFGYTLKIVKNEKFDPYPYIKGINDKSSEILQLLALSYNDRCGSYEAVINCISSHGKTTVKLNNLYAECESLPQDYSVIEKVIVLMKKCGFNEDSLEKLPVSIGWCMADIIHRCREHPREEWSPAVYSILKRSDLSSQTHPVHLLDNMDWDIAADIIFNEEDCETDERSDGMSGLDYRVTSTLWPKDRRVYHARQMLQSSLPSVVDINQRPDCSAHEYLEEQEKHLFGISSRTMALPVGRGMLTLRSVDPVITDPLPIPKLNLTGKAASTGQSIDFSHIDVVPDMNVWPLFHNGVAAGLRLVQNASVDTNWILYNKPKGSIDMYPGHAGFLMALGLNGHLKNFHRMNTFEYLIKFHELTSVALLIGLSSSFRGTMDTTTTKLLSLHIESMLPPTSLELDIDQNIQISALLGLGLVYQGSAHRHIAEVLLSEMGRPPGPEMENCVDRESYTLTAGFALGLVLLGKGSNLCGLTDLKIADTLHHFMVGGHKRPLTGPQREKYKSPSYQIREGDIVNVDVTSPGATVALGLMFFNSGNRAVADWMNTPDSQYVLDFICPDFLLLRTLARGLILWDDIIPSVEWVTEHVPEVFRPYCLVKMKESELPPYRDLETSSQAYCNIVAGACMAIGLRFAGTGNNMAFETINHFCKMFINLQGKSVSELAGKSTVENCLDVTVISLGMVMAGTGDVEVLRICRCLRSRVCQMSNSVVTYGSHLAIHMALGLLFLGAGKFSLSTTPESVAAMLIAFYPKFPTHSNDNRYHLQAFRHLYVLAIEPRLFAPREMDSDSLVPAHLIVEYEDTKHYTNQVDTLLAPCLIPELKYLKSVQVQDERYWPVIFKRGKNWDQLSDMLKSGQMCNIKQRSGYVPNIDETKGGLGLLAASPITPDDCIPWTGGVQDLNKYALDSSFVKMMEWFSDTPEPAKVDVLFRRIVFECVIQNKMYLVPLWISTLKLLEDLRHFPKNYNAMQVKIMCQIYLYGNSSTKAMLHKGSHCLVTKEIGAGIKQYVKDLIEFMEHEYKVDMFDENPEDNVTSSFKESLITVLLCMHDVPLMFNLDSTISKESIIALYSQLSDLLSTSAIQNIWKKAVYRNMSTASKN